MPQFAFSAQRRLPASLSRLQGPEAGLCVQCRQQTATMCQRSASWWPTTSSPAARASRCLCALCLLGSSIDTPLQVACLWCLAALSAHLSGAGSDAAAAVGLLHVGLPAAELIILCCWCPTLPLLSGVNAYSHGSLCEHISGLCTCCDKAAAALLALLTSPWLPAGACVWSQVVHSGDHAGGRHHPQRQAVRQPQRLCAALHPILQPQSCRLQRLG